MDESVKDILLVVVPALIGALSALITSRVVEQTKLKYRLLVENEYRILMRLWKRAYWLKSRAGNLRPQGDHFDEGESEVERRERRLELFENALNRFKEEMFLNKPFYPQELYPILNELRTIASTEAIEYAHAHPNVTKYFDDATKNAERISGLIDQLCDLIRNRLLDQKLIASIKK